MRRLSQRLDIRAGLIAFFLVGLILGVEAFLAFQHSRVATLEDYERDTRSLTMTAANSMAFPLWDFDTEILDQMSEALILNEQVQSVTVIEGGGSIISQRDKKSQTNSKNLTLIEKIPGPDGQELGELKIEFSLTELSSNLRQEFLLSIFRALILSLLVFGVIAWTIRSLAKPVQALLAAVKHYDGRKQIQSVPGSERSDELGSLARGFEQMAGQIYGNVATLETRVEQRTKELSEALNEVEAASKAKSAFLANMSHEIRTPMNGVLGMAQVLQRTELSQEQESFVKTIYDSGFALVTIINDILDYSKIEAGRLELEHIDFNLPSAINDVAMLLGVTAREKNLDLLVKIQPSLPTDYVGDVGRIRQVVTNLVGNAVKFTSEGSVIIDVVGSPKEDSMSLEIRVRDTGIGIEAEKLGSIFEKFNQAENSTTRRYGGTGLGLAISQSLVKAMNGQIFVESTSGKGSQFTVALDLPIAKVQSRDSSQYKFAGQTVLIVDDNETNRSILEHTVRSWNLIPVLVDSAKSALLYLKKAYQANSPIDLILTDYHMPENDGLALVRALRRLEPFKQIEVMALTSSDADDVISGFKSVGVKHIFPKPIKLDVLNGAIQETFSSACVTELNAIRDLPVSPKAKNKSVIIDQPPQSRTKPKILIVDDVRTNREVLSYMINQDAYFLDFAEDGLAAYNKARQTHYDLIFMDISMPRLDGKEATTAIRAFERKKRSSKSVIIALTAHAMKGDRESFLAVGMNDYLSKPIDQDRVVKTLETWLQPNSPVDRLMKVS